MPLHKNAINVLNERHARPPIPIQYPAIVQVFVFLRADCTNHFWNNGSVSTFSALNLTPIQTKDGGVLAQNTHYRASWEKHTEFVTLTLIESDLLDPAESATSALSLPPLPLDAPLPFVSLLIGVQSCDDKFLDDHALFGWYDNVYLRKSSVLSGSTTILSDFQLDVLGRTRILVTSSCELSYRIDRHIQRLIEIEVYGAFVLLTWETVRAVGPLLDKADDELQELVSAISTSNSIDDKELLSHLARLAANHEAVIADSNFRLTAALAYYDIVNGKLNELDEVSIEGVQRFCSFIRRRAVPATKTYQHILKRQNEISERIYRASQLLQSRVDVELASQSQEQLVAMNDRAEAQYRLQKTVEGLSTIAISYYLLGILTYVGKSLAYNYPELPIVENVGFLAPVVVLIVWLALRRVR